MRVQAVEAYGAYVALVVVLGVVLIALALVLSDPEMSAVITGAPA